LSVALVLVWIKGFVESLAAEALRQADFYHSENVGLARIQLAVTTRMHVHSIPPRSGCQWFAGLTIPICNFYLQQTKMNFETEADIILCVTMILKTGEIFTSAGR
jgi:hypothetical protein